MEYERIATCAERIKTALRIKGMKQSDLCRVTKIPKSALSQYLSGAYEPKQDRIYLISRALNVSEAWLMGLDVPMERTKEKNTSLFILSVRAVFILSARGFYRKVGLQIVWFWTKWCCNFTFFVF